MHEKTTCRQIGLIAYPSCKDGYTDKTVWNPYNCALDKTVRIYGKGSSYKLTDKFHSSEYGRVTKVTVVNMANN